MAQSDLHLAPIVSFQFGSARQRRDADRLAISILVVTVLLFFGALFIAFLAYRVWYPAAFIDAAKGLNLALGTTSTIVLLLSGVTMALAVRNARVGSSGVSALLILSFLLGLAALIVRGVEWNGYYVQQLMPAVSFNWTGDDAAPVQLFYVLFYVLTGLHAIQLIIAMAMVVAVWVLGLGRRYGPITSIPVELVGSFWQAGVIVWTFIFPLLYLISRHA